MRTIAFISTLVCISAAFSLGCSDDERRASSSDNETNSVPQATGAVNMEVYATAVQSCPPGNIHIDIGNVNAAPPLVYENGQDGAEVACSVLAEGAKFRAGGSLKKGMFSFSFHDVLTDGTSAVGQVQFSDPKDSTVYASSDLGPCVFQFAPGGEQGVSAGQIFVQFDCSNLISMADPKAACSSRYGYIRLEHCVGSP